MLGIGIGIGFLEEISEDTSCWIFVNGQNLVFNGVQITFNGI